MDIYTRVMPFRSILKFLPFVIMGMLPVFTATGGGEGGDYLSQPQPQPQSLIVPVEYLMDYWPTQNKNNEASIEHYFDHRYGKGNWQLDTEELLKLRFPDAATRKAIPRYRVMKWIEVYFNISLAPGLDVAGVELEVIISEHDRSGNSPFNTHSFVTTKISHLSTAIKEMSFNYHITDGGPYYIHVALIHRKGVNKKVVISRFEDKFTNRRDDYSRLYLRVHNLAFVPVENDDEKRQIIKGFEKQKDVLDMFKSMVFVASGADQNHVEFGFITGWKELLPFRLPKKTYDNIHDNSLVMVEIKQDGVTLLKINPGIMTSRISLGGFPNLKPGQVFDIEAVNGAGKQAVFRTTLGPPLSEGRLIGVRIK